MRIAIMLRTLDEKGGIGVYTYNLVRTLLAIAPHHEFLLLYRSAAHVGRFGTLPNVRERVVWARGKAMWDQVAVPWICRREGIDLVFHPKFTVPLFGAARSVMVLHGADWFLPEAARFYTLLDRAYIRAFMPLYLRRAAAVLSVSRLTTEHFERIFGVPGGKIRTVYFAPAPHFRRVTDESRLAAVRNRYALPPRFILTLSKHAGGERKNMGGILAAYATLHGTVPHALVVGGQDCARFRQDYAIPEEGWGRDVHFPGWIDQQDLPAVYSLADLFLYPSNQEAFPIPVTEAMACGTPIVTSAVNGLAEIAGDAALLVDPDDPAAIADTARHVLRETALRDQLVSAGLDRSREFSWETCARRTLAVLEEVGGRAGAYVRAA
jgi:glycosyltransferase involved in cell wall biosynthesis